MITRLEQIIPSNTRLVRAFLSLTLRTWSALPVLNANKMLIHTYTHRKSRRQSGSMDKSSLWTTVWVTWKSTIQFNRIKEPCCPKPQNISPLLFCPLSPSSSLSLCLSHPLSLVSFTPLRPSFGGTYMAYQKKKKPLLFKIYCHLSPLKFSFTLIATLKPLFLWHEFLDHKNNEPVNVFYYSAI